MFARSRKFGRTFSPVLSGSTDKKSRLSSRVKRIAPLHPTDVIRHPKADLRSQYRRRMEACLITSLALCIVALQFSHELTYEAGTYEHADLALEVTDIPRTEQELPRTAPPSRPAIPIPSMDEDIPEDLTIASTELDLTEIPPPPRPPIESEFESDAPPFVAYDEPPQIVGGYGALLAAIEYPEIARRARIEAVIVICVEIDERGRSGQTRILKGLEENVGFEEAAIAAVKAVKWKPAYQREKPVKVWYSIPVKFQLIDAKQPAT